MILFTIFLYYLIFFHSKNMELKDRTNHMLINILKIKSLIMEILDNSHLKVNML